MALQVYVQQNREPSSTKWTKQSKQQIYIFVIHCGSILVLEELAGGLNGLHSLQIALQALQPRLKVKY
jgi:hypothetical protein